MTGNLTLKNDMVLVPPIIQQRAEGGFVFMFLAGSEGRQKESLKLF